MGHGSRGQQGRAVAAAGRAINIRPAVENDAHHLSALAETAKAHWGYSREVLETWRPQLTISGADIITKIVFVAEIDGDLAGFYSSLPASSSWALDNLWVLPQFMHRGI